MSGMKSKEVDINKDVLKFCKMGMKMIYKIKNSKLLFENDIQLMFVILSPSLFDIIGNIESMIDIKELRLIVDKKDKPKREINRNTNRVKCNDEKIL
jgi:hypothetical protein